jgi:hypothetical protein
MALRGQFQPFVLRASRAGDTNFNLGRHLDRTAKFPLPNLRMHIALSIRERGPKEGRQNERRLHPTPVL